MSTRTTAPPAGGIAIPGRSIRLWGALLLATAAAVVAAYVSTIAFVAMAGLLLIVFAYVAFRAPRPMLTLMVLLPLVDRYVIRGAVPAQFQGYANVLSEGLLVIVAAAILVQGRRSGRILPALRHPMTLLLGSFVAVAIVSTIVNHVGLQIAGLGIEFTIDAFALFFLVRVIGFDERAGELAATAFVGLAFVAGFLSLCQVVLTPDFLGLTTWTGRFGEGLRPASIFVGQPNLLGALLGLAFPFAALAAARRDLDPRLRRASFAVALILAVALVYTFARGTWLSLVIALVVVGASVDRRSVAVSAGIGVAALAIALVLPRGILLEPGSQWSLDLQNAILGRLGAIGEGRDLRFKFIENAVPIVEDHPLVGTGPGTYGGGVAAHFGSPDYTSYTDGAVPIGRTVDNYWLHILVEFGILGAALLVGMLAWVVLELLRAARRTSGRQRVLLAAVAATGIVISLDSGTEMLLEGNTTSFVVWFFLGIGSLIAASVRPEAPGVGSTVPSAAGVAGP